MRLIYLDEAGISADEPVTVVAGVVIDGDWLFKQLEDHIKGLVEEYVPEDKREGFSFHAKELANGGKIFVRGVYPTDKRLEALRKLAEIPSKFMLPIVFGYHRKGLAPEGLEQTPEQEAIVAQSLAFCHCAIAAERYMQQVARRNEIALCVAENNTTARRAVKAMHRLLAMPTRPVPFPSIMEEHLPIKRLVDTVHFADKTEAVLLQLSDVCAYVIKRYITNAKFSTELFEIMVKKLPASGTFDAVAGYHFFVPYMQSKVAYGQAWLASRHTDTCG